MRPRAGRRGLVVPLLLAACATAQSAGPPPSEELEAPESYSEYDPSDPNRRKVFDRPPTDQEALEKSFQGDPAPDTQTATEGMSDEALAPPSASDPNAEAKARLQAEAQSARKLIAAGSLDEAGSAVSNLESAAEALGPPEQQLAAEVALRLAEAQKDGKAGRKAFERWLLACGPERIDGCRGKAMSALNALARAKVDAAWIKGKIENIRTHDDCLQKAEAAARAKSALPPCLDAASGFYRRSNDKLMLARVYLAKGGAAQSDGEQAAFFSKAERACDEPRCAATRRRALKRLGWALVRSGDLPGAAKAMLGEAHVYAQTLPPDRRPFARTSEVEQVCAMLDGKDGAGSCRKIEHASFGQYTFRDFSAEKVGEGLPPAKVKQVNDHFSVMMQSCLQTEAERLVPPASVKYEIRWMVTNDGRVDQVKLGRRDQESTAFADCVRKQFAVWRYPRYQGERQHVEQVFTVNARQKFNW